MLQTKPGIWVLGGVSALVLISMGYGMGRRAGLELANSSRMVAPAGAPLPAIQIEPIEPQEELAAIIVTPIESSPAQGTLPMEESARVREIQLALRSAGFNPGPVDGLMGQRTRTAVRDFQVAHGLSSDGKIGPKTWSKLETFLDKNQSNE